MRREEKQRIQDVSLNRSPVSLFIVSVKPQRNFVFVMCMGACSYNTYTQLQQRRFDCAPPHTDQDRQRSAIQESKQRGAVLLIYSAEASALWFGARGGEDPLQEDQPQAPGQRSAAQYRDHISAAQRS